MGILDHPYIIAAVLIIVVIIVIVVFKPFSSSADETKSPVKKPEKPPEKKPPESPIDLTPIVQDFLTCENIHESGHNESFKYKSKCYACPSGFTRRPDADATTDAACFQITANQIENRKPTRVFIKCPNDTVQYESKCYKCPNGYQYYPPENACLKLP
jgi:hypothetical protein